MERSGLGALLEDARLNAGLGWILVAFTLLVGVGSLIEGDLVWAGFAATVASLAILPAVAFRAPRFMIPWEVLALAAFPLAWRLSAVATGLGSGQIATYLGVAAVALIVAVELHLFTTVEMSTSFAVAFVVIATMAAAGVWAVVRWIPDMLIGTQFLLVDGVQEAELERRLMFNFVASTAAGIGAGILFAMYFRRRARGIPTGPPRHSRAGKRP